MRYRYGRSWHKLLRPPIDETIEAQARKAWDKGSQITVAAFEDHDEDHDQAADPVPAYTLTTSLQGQDIRVCRYDAAGSCVRMWDYERRDDRLFLEEDTRWTYPDDAQAYEFDEAEEIRFVFFHDDGSADVGFTPEGSGRAGTRTGLDLSSNWLPALAWGDWDRVGRHEPDGILGS